MGKFWRINRWVHQYYDLDLKDFLDSWRDNLIEYFNNCSRSVGINNVYCDLPEFNKHLDNIFEPIIHHYYDVDRSYTQSDFNIYIQNNKTSKPVLHNHAMGTGTITGVIYISPPKEGGGIEFDNPPKEPFSIRPEENVLTLFPAWMYHRPLPQNDTKERICINYSYSTYKRPVHKISGDLW